MTGVNSLQCNISWHILPTVLYALPKVLMRRICETIKSLSLVTISFILVTLMFDSGVILQREIRCWSLFGVKRLSRPLGNIMFI